MLVLQRQITSEVHQVLDHLKVTSVGCEMQGCEPVVSLAVDPGEQNRLIFDLFGDPLLDETHQQSLSERECYFALFYMTPVYWLLNETKWSSEYFR
jgi:hypothetical protein